MPRMVQKQPDDLLLASAALLASLVLSGCSVFSPTKPVDRPVPPAAPADQSGEASPAAAAGVVPTDLDTQNTNADFIALAAPAEFASLAVQPVQKTFSDAPDALDRPSMADLRETDPGTAVAETLTDAPEASYRRSVIPHPVYLRHAGTWTATPETSFDAPDALDRASATSVFARAVYFRHPGTGEERSREETSPTQDYFDLATDAPDEQDPFNDVTSTADTPEADTAEDIASTPAYTDIWDRIRGGLRIPKLDHQRVAYHERWFRKNPRYMKRKMKRASLFLYHIVEEIDRRGLPMDLALLPAIESAYQPHAYSHARASGLWQFIAPTARRYGLKVNWWYDGRRDVVASTTAALNYLEDLYAEFNDWYLALAAYNAGEGKIRYLREMNRRRGIPTDYLHLRRLRSETHHYVPKLMAMVNIVSNPDRYGIALEPIPNEPYFARVDLGSQIDLNVVAKLADVPVGDLYDINPGFRRWATDPTGPHQVLVPVANKDTLIAGLTRLPEGARIKWRRHRVKRGDTLGAIGKRYGVSVTAIKRANNVRGTLIHVNQNLMIPISSRPLSRNIANITRPLPRSSVGPRGRAKVIHRVRKGETLWSIARKYRVYVKQLARWNRMRTRDVLRVGRRLKVWIRPTQVSSVDNPSSG